MLDCGIIRWEDIFPNHDDMEDPSSYHSTRAMKGEGSALPTSPCSPSNSDMTIITVFKSEYDRLQDDRQDLIKQLQAALVKVKELQIQSNLHRLEVEQMKGERQRIRDALEGRDFLF